MTRPFSSVALTVQLLLEKKLNASGQLRLHCRPERARVSEDQPISSLLTPRCNVKAAVQYRVSAEKQCSMRRGAVIFD